MQTGSYDSRSYSVELSGICPISAAQRYQPGVYAISGLLRPLNDDATRCLYIGSSVDPLKRIDSHLYALRAGTHHNEIVQGVYGKEGGDSMTFLLLESCSRDDVRQREQNWIDYYSATYGFDCLMNLMDEVDNPMSMMTPEARASLSRINSERWTGEGNPMYGSARVGDLNPFHQRQHSDETKQRLRESANARVARGDIPMKGRHHTPEAKERFRQIALARPPWSEERRQAVSLKSKGRPNLLDRKPVVQIDAKTGAEIKRFEFTMQASKETGIDHSSISRVCRGKPLKGRVCRTAGGFIWRFLAPDGTIIQPTHPTP